MKNKDVINDEDAMLELIKATIKKYNTVFIHKRIRDTGNNPNTLKMCDTCEVEYPLYLFSISRDSTIYDKCRCCFAADEQMDRYTEEFLREWKKSRKETRSQATIRRLGEQVKALGIDWRKEWAVEHPNEETFDKMLARMTKKYAI